MSHLVASMAPHAIMAQEDWKPSAYAKPGNKYRNQLGVLQKSHSSK